MNKRTPPRDARATLAANLQRMIDAETPTGQRPSVRAWAMSKGLDVRLIDRMTKRQHAVTLDKLEEVARACDLEPWHLLIHDLDKNNLPDAPISESDRTMIRKLRRILGDNSL